MSHCILRQSFAIPMENYSSWRALQRKQNIASLSAASTASLKGRIVEVAGGTTVEHLLHRRRRMRRVHPTDDVVHVDWCQG